MTDGDAMSKKLRLEDRQATDLLLDQMTAAARGNGHALYAGPHAGLRPRVQRLQRLLHLLESAPIDDPPRDLVSRTLEKIDLAVHHKPVLQPGHHFGSIP
jgi:hypothetical protein